VDVTEAFGEEWVLEHFIDLAGDHGKLVEYFFVGARMMCLFEDFEVQEVGVKTKQVERSFNLQEIQGFEISEEIEQDSVLAFALEKDVQLLAVACKQFVHVFEYQEEP
jgi:hypothetical protein